MLRFFHPLVFSPSDVAFTSGRSQLLKVPPPPQGVNQNSLTELSPSLTIVCIVFSTHRHSLIGGGETVHSGHQKTLEPVNFEAHKLQSSPLNSNAFFRWFLPILQVFFTTIYQFPLWTILRNPTCDQIDTISLQIRRRTVILDIHVLQCCRSLIQSKHSSYFPWTSTDTSLWCTSLQNQHLPRIPHFKTQIIAPDFVLMVDSWGFSPSSFTPHLWLTICTCFFFFILPAKQERLSASRPRCIIWSNHECHLNGSWELERGPVRTMTLTAYLTLYAPLVHQGKGTEYPR